MITLNSISKSYKVAKRSSGFRHALKALFHREYTIIEALNDISFSISPGEIVGYIGPNGAGKSTTIKVMSGILVPDQGSCTIMGYTPWLDRVSYVKHIGVVFGQRSQLWWDVPVQDSFDLLCDIYNVPNAEYRDTLALLMEALDLGGIVNMPVRQLSLGQRMRCEIAASLLHNPSVLFLDEPTIGLDAVSKIAVRQFIKTINKERGVTVILTTHDMNDIEALAQRIILIGKGSLLYDGNLHALRNRFGTHKTITVDYREHISTNVIMMASSHSSFDTASDFNSDSGYDVSSATPRSDANSKSKPSFSTHCMGIIGTTLISMLPERIVLSVATEQVTSSDVLIQLSQRIDLLDVTIDTQPIEDIIVQLYKEYQI